MSEKNPHPIGSTEAFFWEVENFKRVMVGALAPMCVPILRYTQRMFAKLHR